MLRRKELAVRQGFEPWEEVKAPSTVLANRRLQPLGHLTVSLQVYGTKGTYKLEAPARASSFEPTVPEIVPGSRLHDRESGVHRVRNRPYAPGGSILVGATERIATATSNAIRERSDRAEVLCSGQAALFKTIRNVLLSLGAGLLVVGKWLTLTGACHRRRVPLSA